MLNKKGISQSLSVLLMILIAVLCSIVVYAWVMGYMGFTTTKSGFAEVEMEINPRIHFPNDNIGILNEIGFFDINVKNKSNGTIEVTAEVFGNNEKLNATVFKVDPKSEKNITINQGLIYTGTWIVKATSSQGVFVSYSFITVANDIDAQVRANELRNIQENEKLAQEANAMSNQANNIAILSLIISAVSGFIVVGISYLTYKSQKPNLDVKVKGCSHHFQKSELFDPEMEIRFLASLEIENRGDRGTTLSKIELSFVENGKKHVLENEIYGKQTEGTDSWGKKTTQVERRWINPFETITMSPIFVDEYKGRQKEEIDCILTIYSTHKTYKVKFRSKRDAKFIP